MLVNTLVQLGRDLGLRALAEGMQTTGGLDHLRGESVNEGQGFLLSQPLDAQAVETQLLWSYGHRRRWARHIHGRRPVDVKTCCAYLFTDMLVARANTELRRVSEDSDLLGAVVEDGP